MQKSRFEIAEKAVQLGRQNLLKYFGQIEHIESKHKQGLVSEADQTTENIMKTFLQKNCPEIEFLGEETSYEEGSPEMSSTEGMRWILDPLDGTTNYIHRFPVFCISLGLEINKEMVLGIIDVPLMNQTFYAEKNKGAFLGNKKLSVTQNNDFEKALVATGFFAEETELLEEQLQIFSQVVRKVRGVRRAGAAAYDLAMVSDGIFDVFWEKNLKPWDTAAGQVIVQEAGGKLMSYEGRAYNPYEKSVIAGTPALVERMVQLISKLK